MRDDIQLQEHNQRLRFSVAVSLTDILALETLAREALAESRFSRAAASKDKFKRAAELVAGDADRHGVLSRMARINLSLSLIAKSMILVLGERQ